MYTASLALRAFAHDHDELPAFHAAYMVLVLMAAALLNSGVFALLIAAHMSLDVVKYHDVHGFSWPATFRASFRESLTDLALLGFAIVAGVYLHHGSSIAAAGGVYRAEIVIMRALAIVIPRMEILCHVLHVFSGITAHMRAIGKKARLPFKRWERWVFAALGLELALVAMGPWLLHMDLPHYVEMLADNLVPWRF